MAIKKCLKCSAPTSGEPLCRRCAALSRSLVGLGALIVGLLLTCLTLVAQAQPVTRHADYTLADRVVYRTGGGPIGAYSVQTLEMPRLPRGRFQVALVVTGWGDKLLVAWQVEAPSRAEWQEVAVVEVLDSQWAPLSGAGVAQQVDGGGWRVLVTLYYTGGNNGWQQLDNLSPVR